MCSWLESVIELQMSVICAQPALFRPANFAQKEVYYE